MKRIPGSVLIFLVALCVLFPPFSYGQLTIDFEGVDSEQEEEVLEAAQIEKTSWESKNSTEEVLRLWFMRKSLLEEGNDKDAMEQLLTIKRMSEERVINELDVIGGALLFEAYSHMSEGRYDAAIESFNLALTYDSSLYQANFGKSHAYFRKNKFFPFPYIVEFFQGTKARFRSFWSLFTTTSNIFIILLTSLIIAGFLYTLILGLKNLSALRHEFQERFSGKVSPYIAGALGLGIIFIPLILWFDLIWLYFFWVVIFWRYYRFVEKIVVSLTLVLLLLVIPSLKMIDQLYASTYDDYVKASISSINGTFDLDRLQKINEMILDNPGDNQLRFVAALLYRNGGYYDQAQGHLEAILKKDERNYKALLNLGNIYYLSQDPYVAIKYYQEAIDLKPDSAKAYFNMSKAYENAFRFDEAQKMKDKALAINPDLVAESKGDEGKKVFDEYPDKRTVIKRFITTRERSFDVNGMFFNSHSMIIFLCIVLIFVNSFISSRFSKASACTKCGRAFCDVCKIATESDVYCSQCEHIYLKKDGVSPETKIQKMYEIEKYSRYQTIFKTALNIVIPGSGFAYINKNILALPLLWLASLGLVMFFVQDVLITYSKGIISEIQFPVAGLGITIFILSWFFSNPLSWWKRF